MKRSIWLFILLASPIFVLGDNTEDGEVTERSIQCQNNSDSEVEVSLASQDATIDDEVKIRLQLDDEGYEVQLEYHGAANGSEVEFQFKLKLIELVEFTPEAGQIGFTAGATNVVRHPITDYVWGQIRVVDPTADPVEIHMDTADGSIQFTAWFTSTGATLPSGYVLSPNGVKIDVDLHSLVYTRTDTRYAIYAAVETDSETQYHVEGTADDADEVNVGESTTAVGSLVSGNLGWATTAHDGAAPPNTFGVVAATLDPTAAGTDNEYGMYFTFDTSAQPVDIYWDPDVTVKYQNSAAQLSISIFAILAVVTALLQ